LISNLALLAFLFGLLCAASLPLGAVAGLWLKPSDRVVAGIMAFGAGALLAALTFELVAEALERAGFFPLALGSVLGAGLFVVFNYLINERGAFLRKPATFLKYLRRRKRALASEVLARLSRVEILRSLPPKEIQAVFPFVRPCSFGPGERVFEEGAVGDALYMIDSGEVDVLSQKGAGGPSEGTSGERRIARLGPGETFGEMALLTGEPRVATVLAIGPVKAWKISKDDFDRLVHASPELAGAVKDLMDRRLRGARPPETNAERWHKEALKSIEPAALAPTPLDLRHAVQAHGGAPMAIWLGNFLDGIPESLVVGASLLHSDAIRVTLILGLFLANLPEAMSAAVGMRRQGQTAKRVLWMWTSLMLVTGIGALLGNIFFQNAPVVLFALCEAAAAGAILAMVAETMLPEAFEQGGHLVGIMTLLGFLCAIYVKTLETPH
jgi:CRP-like cAMP-binding protein